MTTQPSPLQNRYDRFELSPGLVAWVYEYGNAQPLKKDAAMASGLELGVQLHGEWLQRGSRSGQRLYQPGMIHCLSPAETYDLSYQARERPGVQIGFIVYPDKLERLANLDGELRFAAGAALSDPLLLALCADFFRDARASHMPAELARSAIHEVTRFVERNGELAPKDPLCVAKQMLDSTFNQALYLQHIAEVAQMHPTTFSRKFAERFGVTPIHYRLMLRLNEAARLTWARPDWSIGQIARHVGFDDLVYFHRVFRQQFRMTPLTYGRRPSRDGKADGQTLSRR